MLCICDVDVHVSVSMCHVCVFSCVVMLSIVCDVCAVVFYVIVSHVSLFVSCIYCVIFFCFYVCVCGKEL